MGRAWYGKRNGPLTIKASRPREIAVFSVGLEIYFNPIYPNWELGFPTDYSCGLGDTFAANHTTSNRRSSRN
jgi:hypothetical protein